MEIIKYKNRLNESRLMPISTTQIDSIAIHHMDHPTATLDEVTSWHVDENHWDWVGYSYWIGFDGTVYECRGVKYLASAVKENNGHIVSIGFQGQYNQNNSMPEAQFNAGVNLIRYLLLLLPKVATIDGHNHWNDTSCPGKYFPLNKMIEEAKNMFNDDTQIAEYAKEAVQHVYEVGIMKGDTDGNFKPKDFIKREDFAVAMNKLLKLLGK